VDGRRPVRRALVGVSDKAGVVELGTALHAAGVQIVSTGNTARALAEAGVPVTPVEELTGFPESFGGRVKTLHPKVHAGLLADLNDPEHVDQLRTLEIAPFDLLVVNLYPFTATVASGASPTDCVEQIDIGGPAMVRAAAKNHANVAVVVDPARYDWVAEQVKAGGFTFADRRALAVDAFRHTATYDIAVASWMGSVLAPEPGTVFPAWSARAGSARTCCGTARTRTRAPRCTWPTTAVPAWPPPASCTARRCRTTTTSTRTPPGAPRTTTTARAWPSSSTQTLVASPFPPWPSRQRSRTRTARRTPATRSARSAA